MFVYQCGRRHMYLFVYFKPFFPDLMRTCRVNFLFLTSVERSGQSTGRCQAASIALHYFLLAALGCMVCEAIQLYRAFVSVFEGATSFRKQMLGYVALAWGLPVVVVAVTAGSALRDYTSATYCWLDGGRPAIWAFLAPAIAALAVNATLLGVVIWKIRQCGGNMMTARAMLALGTLVGATWLFGLLVPLTTNVAVQFLFAIFNSCQGVRSCNVLWTQDCNLQLIISGDIAEVDEVVDVTQTRFNAIVFLR